MPFAFSPRSLARLEGVHPDLIRVANGVIGQSPIDFAITEGVRSPSRQKKLVEEGASRTLDSRHLTGHAIDIAAFVAGQLRWEWHLYEKIAVLMKECAHDIGVSVIWGGNWRSFKDGCHFELNRRIYP